ncbi:MAG TPA: hypothetical protein VII43_04065 [Opitutaceae bacterium]
MKQRRIAPALIGAATAAAVLWMYASHGSRERRPPQEAVPIQDAKTIDFSGGSPVVRDGAADRAAMDAALKKIDAAAGTVTFQPDPPPKK